MNRKSNNRGLVAVALAVAVLAGSLAVTAARAQDLPKATQVIEDFIKATGGRDAYAKNHNVKVTGTFSMPAMGVTAPMTSYQEAPNKGYTIIRSDAFGTIENGCDGTVQWEKSMMTGAKIKEGEEKAVADRQGTFNLLLRWQDFYTAAETVAQEEVEGRPCWKVVMTPIVGEPETTWYDVETHLQVKSSMAMNSDMGRLTVDIYSSDFREVDGVLMAFNNRQVLMGMQEMVIVSDTVEFDVDIPAGTFDLPEDVKALVK